MYKIIGHDGQTYGPATAAQIRDWIAQKRVESRTPVLPEGATEWTLLGLLAEFAPHFSGPPPVIAPLRGTNGFATAGFVCGILSFACCCGCPFSILGMIFSSIALTQIGNQVQKQAGWGLALAGLICSAVSLLVNLALGIFQLVSPATNVSWHFGAL